MFQGRYKAIVVERDRYCFVLCRSMVRKPMRAGRVQMAQAYDWSSSRKGKGDLL